MRPSLCSTEFSLNLDSRLLNCFLAGSLHNEATKAIEIQNENHSLPVRLIVQTVFCPQIRALFPKEDRVPTPSSHWKWNMAGAAPPAMPWRVWQRAAARAGQYMGCVGGPAICQDRSLSFGLLLIIKEDWCNSLALAALCLTQGRCHMSLQISGYPSVACYFCTEGRKHTACPVNAEGTGNSF